MINITDADILYAERILLKENQHFDDERVTFIKNLETMDLQAVPGSGKTTAILAKLLILEKYMPLENNSGVLVISHTNAAVDEIRERIGKYCPKLFSYPNFVGTIQSFVDTFLAVPFYVNKLNARPYRIDNEIHDEQVEKFYKNTSDYGLKSYLSRQHDPIGFLKSIRMTPDGELISYLNGTPESFKLKNKSTRTYKSLLNFKLRLLKNGCLHFDDAYTLANVQLQKIPKCKDLLQLRFKYVMIDEMQDMDVHQHDLLEDIFFDNGNSISNYQRIGDKNQAIYNGGSIHVDDIWSQRESILYLNGSHRINLTLAPIIESFSLTLTEIEGRKKNENNTEINIKPHLLIFNNETKTEVIKTYADIIGSLQETGEIPNPSSHKFMAIAWRKEHPEDGKLGLSDYWDDYSIAKQETKTDFNVLRDYLLFFDDENRLLGLIRKNILNAFLKILRLENLHDEHGRSYSKRKLLHFIKENNIDKYERFKLHLYKWSIAIVQMKTEEAYSSITEYLPEFLEIFKKDVDKSVDFITGEASIEMDEVRKVKQSNTYELNDVKIEIGTVHSVKGQTHTATLYLETFFDRGYGSYESERLRNQFLGENVIETLSRVSSSKNKIKQSAKMAYVGFSRPTHLLCVAVHEDRFQEVLSKINREVWEIKECK